MALAVASSTQTTPADSATHVVTKPSGVADGDYLMVCGSTDQDGNLGMLGAPDASWISIHSGGSGGGSPNQAGWFRIWYKYAASEGASWTFTSSAATNSQFTALRITGASGAYVVATNAGGTTTHSTTHLAPTLGALGAGDLLICGWQIIAEAAASTYVAQGSMTQHGTAGSVSGTWLRHLVASELLTTGGLTGTRTMTTSLDPPNWGDTTWSLVLSTTFVPATGFSPDQITARGIPLTVRLKTRRKDMDVTAQINDLSFRSSIPGGYASCQISLNRPLDIQPDEIEYFATLYVYDGRNGSTTWEGRLEDPGRGAGDQGEVWSITAVGPKVHAQDLTFPVIYVDKSLERWKRSRYSHPRADTSTSEIADDVDSLMVSVPQGTVIDTTWAGDWIYRHIYYCGQRLARVRWEHIEGGASTNYQVKMFTRQGTGTALFSTAQNWAVTEQTMACNLGTASWDNTADVVSYRAQRDVSGTTADAVAWSQAYNVVVRAVVKNVDGSDNLSTSGYNVNNIDPIEVVMDLLGRALPKYDGANAVLVGSGVDIDQLCYPDGTTAEQILNDLALYDPGFYWAAWETNPATLKNRFEYKPWPSTVRYEAGIEDGFDSPGSASDLYNAVRVRYLNPNNSVRTIRRTQTVQELTDAGITREAYIDLSDEIGSVTTAAYVGDNFLNEHRYPPNAGTLRIGRPIIDNDTGRMVHPWEILPGNLIRVRGVLPRVDALNPTNRDGVTVFRVVSIEFSISDGIAVLELDSYTRTLTRTVADISKAIGHAAGKPSLSGTFSFRKR
jgi:hypothetical protein